MSQAFTGNTGSGSVDTFTTPLGGTFVLEGICFVVTTDGSAGIHKARVTLTDPASHVPVFVLRDLNEGGPSETLTYTYGIGLNSSACVTVTGWEMTNPLPQTELYPGTVVNIAMVDDNGGARASDAISRVTLYGNPITATTIATVPLPSLSPALLPA
jgi:hypothetical protein